MEILCDLLWFTCVRTVLRVSLCCRNERQVSSCSCFKLCKINKIGSIVGHTLEETAALFDDDEEPTDLSSMGGSAAAIGIRLTTVVSVVDGDSEMMTENLTLDKREEYYKMMKRYQDTDNTTSSTGVHTTGVY